MQHQRQRKARGVKARRWRRITAALLLLAMVVLIARALLPVYVRKHVNGVLDRSEAYDGQIGEIDLHLWRGAYSIDDLKIVKTERSVPVPFFEARRVDFSLDWNALLHGKARGKISMDHPVVNFVHGPTEEETQIGDDEPWLGMIEELFPFEIDKADIDSGTIYFRAFFTQPQVDVHLSDVQATITNLTNVEGELEQNVATVRATATAMNSGRLEFDMTLDPFSYRPTFQLAARLLDMDVTELRDLTRAYGQFDFEAGTFDFIVELASEEGFVEGYAKPLFRNLQVLSLRDLEHDDPLQIFWEALVGTVQELFQNQPRDQFGTRLSLEGTLDNPRMNIFEIIGNILFNAFVRAFLPRFDDGVAPEATVRVDEVLVENE